MTIVLILNVLLASLVCFGVIGGLAWSMVSRHTATTPAPAPAEIAA